MVMTSSDIAAQSAAFQQQSMQQMQYSQMLSQHAPNINESIAGGVINTGAAIGKPMAALGLGMMGLDPMSMALKGGMAGFRAGGLVGGAVGAVGAALPMMAAGMAVNYAGGQMMEGISQQQRLGGMLGSVFQHQNIAGGRGFMGHEVGNIGSMFRQMTTQAGPGGEFSTFDELGRLAVSMQRMGGAAGVRNVNDFTTKFKAMIKEVKEVATAFHTTLEEAQQAMASFKQVGVFKNQGAFAKNIAAVAGAGGLAVSEVTQMMGIGAQIARSIGGQASAGARGGMNTIGWVGAAQQMGTLTEADIYNQTGLTGAEGRQAMATQMMGQSASFLKSGLGRRFLASMAGKDGSINETDAMSWMMGGMGTGETMASANRNLAGVGRANFVRNEGRLRGAALEKFGGLAPVIAMRGWLEQRGLNVTSGDDDRAMWFMQNRLGLGEDEAANMTKMVRDLPNLLKAKDMVAAEGRAAEEISIHKSKQGMSGLGHKFEKFKNSIQSALQQVGADVYEGVTNAVDSFVSKLTGETLNEYRASLAPVIQDVLRGGAMGKAVGSKYFGLGGDMLKAFRGGGFATADQSMTAGVGGGIGDTILGGIQKGRGAGASPYAQFKSSGDLDRFNKAGYYVNESDFAGSMKQINAMAAAGSDTSLESLFSGRGSAAVLGVEFKEAVIRGDFANRGSGFAADFSKFIEGSASGREMLKDPKFAAEYAAAKKDPVKMQQMASGLAAANNLSDFATAMSQRPDITTLFGSGKFGTEHEKLRAIGGYMLGGERKTAGYSRDAIAAQEAAMGSGWVDSGSVHGAVREALGAAQFGDEYSEKEMKAAAGFLTSDKGMDIARDVLSGNAEARDALEKRVVALQGQSERSDVETGELEASKSILLSNRFQDLVNKGMTQEEAMQTLNQEQKRDVSKRVFAVGAALTHEQQVAREQLFTSVRTAGDEGLKSARAGGIVGSGGVLSAAGLAAFKIGGTVGGAGPRMGEAMTTGQEAMSRIMAGLQSYSEVTAGMSDAEKERLTLAGMESKQSGFSMIGSMSVQDQLSMAAAARESGQGDIANDIQRRAILEQKLSGFGRNTATAGQFIAGQLGSGVASKDLLGKDSTKQANLILNDVLGDKGLASTEGQEAKRMLKEALDKQQKGDVKGAADQIKNITDSNTIVGKAIEEKKAKQEAADNPVVGRLDKVTAAIKELKAGIPLTGGYVSIAGPVKVIKEGEGHT